MLLKDPEVTQFTILDLSPFTQYLVSLQVVNPAGLGPPTKVVVMTDEGGKLLFTVWKFKNFPATQILRETNIVAKKLENCHWQFEHFHKAENYKSVNSQLLKLSERQYFFGVKMPKFDFT